MEVRGRALVKMIRKLNSGQYRLYSAICSVVSLVTCLGDTTLRYLVVEMKYKR